VFKHRIRQLTRRSGGRSIPDLAESLREARVVNDPSLDRPLPLDRRQDQFAHIGLHLFVALRRVGDKMQQRSVCATTRAGAVNAAIGSTLLRSPGTSNPRQ